MFHHVEWYSVMLKYYDSRFRATLVAIVRASCFWYAAFPSFFGALDKPC